MSQAEAKKGTAMLCFWNSQYLEKEGVRFDCIVKPVRLVVIIIDFYTHLMTQTFVIEKRDKREPRMTFRPLSSQI